MSCEKIRTELSLYLYGELNHNEEEVLEQHVSECAGCQEELRRERAIHAAFDTTDAPLPAQLLTDCRRDLRVRLANESESRSQRNGWFTWMLRPAGAVALIAVGFFSSRLVPTFEKPDVKASRVSLVEPGNGGNVRITLEETRERTVQGSPTDAAIQALLISAAQDPTDPSLRSESIAMLHEGSQSDDMRVRHALVQAVSSDPNPGVRLRALESLKPYAGQTDVRRALANVLLNDDNAGLRTQAIEVLTKHQERDMVEVFQELMRREDNNYIRQRSQEALISMNASVEAF
jgi:hypothetical protein